jgi:sec-independent protein translocase protein TatA
MGRASRSGGEMGNIGGTELLIIFIVALLLLGPKRLPEIGDALGRSLRKFRAASREIQDEIDVLRDIDDDKKKKS